MFSIRTIGLQTTLIELNINNILKISKKIPDSLKNRGITTKKSSKTEKLRKMCSNLAYFHLQST